MNKPLDDKERRKMDLHDFYYDLPKELIAQHPAERRDGSRLMLLDKKTGEIGHGKFPDILDYFEEGDCLVLNDSKVIPARLFGHREGKEEQVEIFLLRARRDADTWECLVKPGKKAREGDILYIKDVKATVVSVEEDGNRVIRFECDGDFSEKIKDIGQIPLPPYITAKDQDYSRYQTVYAKYDGSVAAPTAGLHFTQELLGKLKAKGVKICFVTLHVGLGTFRPVKVENITEHKMHSEFFILPERTAEIINETKAAGKKVTAVGTTCCRVLETAGRTLPLQATSGDTDIFIYPGFEFHVIDRLITNFHLPESTLVMLVSALAGRENILNAYSEAVKEKYRFFSFGDAMFIH